MSKSSDLIDRYQAYRTRRFTAQEAKWATLLPGWRSQHRRRILVAGLAVTFAFMVLVSIVCAFGVDWAPLLWLPACLAFFALWPTLQIVSGKQSDAPDDVLDEWQAKQRNDARGVGFALTNGLTFIPAAYLIIVGTLQVEDPLRTAYAGGLMVLTALLIGGCAPAIILAWQRPDPETEDTE